MSLTLLFRLLNSYKFKHVKRIKSQIKRRSFDLAFYLQPQPVKKPSLPPWHPQALSSSHSQIKFWLPHPYVLHCPPPWLQQQFSNSKNIKVSLQLHINIPPKFFLSITPTLQYALKIKIVTHNLIYPCIYYLLDKSHVNN